jgi:hypothetical protein
MDVGTGTATRKVRRLRRGQMRIPPMKHGSGFKTACLPFDPLGIRPRVECRDQESLCPSSSGARLQQGPVVQRTEGEVPQVWHGGSL